MLYYLTTAFEGWLGDSVYWVIQIFTQFHFRAFAALIFSFLFVLLLGPRTIRRLTALKVGDNPEFYNQDLNTLNQAKRNTPTMGGILIVGAIVASVVLFGDIVGSRYVHLSLLILLWLAGVGVFDDWLKLTAARRAAGTREGLFAWEKLLFQLTNFGDPVIRVVDANHQNRGELLLVHDHMGVDLRQDYAKETLASLVRVWKRPVALATKVDGKSVLARFDGSEHTVSAYRV
jgi:hypothetical protein